jgi:ABC-2 type transport system ATP-binding protein
MRSGEAAIVARTLTRRYGARAVVDRLDLEIPAGSVFGFLGPNGAGKSTSLRMLCGLLRPTSGEARVAGFDPAREPDALKRVVGLMPQSFGLYDHLTAREHLEFQAGLRLASSKEGQRRCEELIDFIGLQGVADQPAGQLSAGWQQRLSLACAVIHRPRVVFLDEPTAGVDPVSRRMFWDLIFALNEEGTTFFVTTHYMEEVERCHCIGLIAAGKLRTCGAPQELKRQIAESRELVSVTAEVPEAAFAALRELPLLIDAYRYGERIHLAFEPGAEGVRASREALATVATGACLVETRGAATKTSSIAASRSST